MSISINKTDDNTFYNDEHTHYVFLADDLILNPVLNESNIISTLLQNNDSAGFITSYKMLNVQHIKDWIWTISALDALLNNLGCQFEKFLPSYKQACEKMEKHGLSSKNIPVDLAKQCIINSCNTGKYYIKSIKKDVYKKIVKKYNSKNDNYTYPLARGFSDFFILPKEKIEEICYLFGVFSSANIFVEIATPTSMLLSLDKVYSADMLNTKADILWCSERTRFDNKHKNNFKEFYDNFEQDTLYVHPVKLSQWNMEE